YLLDEPTTGLSFSDTAALLGVLHRLVDSGNTVILIEHNLDVIKNSDWLIDLGPGAGDKGGKLIATGTPEQLAANEKSFTGKYLKNLLTTSGRGANSAKTKSKAKAAAPKAAKKPSKSKAKEPAVAAAGD
ncbi:MAG: excinuclease ABC subunit A, partial [Chloroflexi bacterium]|nr:excinuclease ABC subunit A [Chloroflexota bacterium]